MTDRSAPSKDGSADDNRADGPYRTPASKPMPLAIERPVRIPKERAWPKRCVMCDERDDLSVFEWPLDVSGALRRHRPDRWRRPAGVIRGLTEKKRTVVLHFCQRCFALHPDRRSVQAGLHIACALSFAAVLVAYGTGGYGIAIVTSLLTCSLVAVPAAVRAARGALGVDARHDARDALGACASFDLARV